jgi:hypothetical protein
MEVIRKINRKLAPLGKVVFKTRGKAERTAGREYQLRDCWQGTQRDLSLDDVRRLARDLGLLSTQLATQLDER